MKSRSAKSKGRRAGVETKELLLAHCTHLEDADIAVVPSGVPGRDLWLSPKAQSHYPFAIENKNCEKLNVWEALAQAQNHVKNEKEIPVLFFKRNRSELYVSLKAKDFLKLLKEKKK